MNVWQSIKNFFSASWLKANGLKKIKLKNGRVALVDKRGNFKGFQK